MAETLKATKREKTGKIANRKLRLEGKIPAVLYGDGKDVINLALCAEQFSAVVRHGAKNITLEGDVSESVVMREVQWDTFGTEVLHVDFYRPGN
ncbi:hypothetical protein DTL21_03300 [Bremerella cremea]|uniref:50S ribosomal protein L25 n=1 Tax=Blastopirellula marina TaxID=124 RepID=A0A2S8G5Q4_9BACT|nr:MULTISPECIES: hypothetical protein [Pirellulaceae]PQO39782.1 hypothetical protein C5Y83_03300 [Blastopirellula marina]RCS51249.1 hypothetical protein DTL21_03300 [Bremerella cremea]